MKKYLIFSIILIFILTISPSLLEKILAQTPSFEVIPAGGTAYPTVTNLTASVDGNELTITATATDVSGVYSVKANIKNSSLVLVDANKIMQPVGSGCDVPGASCSYVAVVNISSYPEDNYTIDVIAIDNLLNSSQGFAYASLGSFTTIISTTAELWTGQAETYWGSNDVFGSNDVYGAQDPYNTFFHDSRAQFIVSAADLTGAGMASGDNISDIYLKTNLQPGRDLANFTIKAKLTSSDITTSWEGGWTSLYGPTTISNSDPDLAANGNWKLYHFSQNFEWNGTSNIMFDISRNDSSYAVGGGMYVRTNTGSNRMFAGDCDSCVDGSGLQVPDRISGNQNGMTFNLCPDLKIIFNSL